MLDSLNILAAATPSVSAGVPSMTFELGRIQSPLDWFLPAAVFVVLSWFVIGMYVLDCRELGGRLATLLIALRLLALDGLLAVYLQPQWRTRREVVDPSRVVLLVDTSQSMAYRDSDSGTSPATNATTNASPNSAKGSTLSAAGPSRIDHVIEELTNGNLLPSLRRVHDVAVYRFDEGDGPTAVATLPRVASTTGPDAVSGDDRASASDAVHSTRLLLAGIGALGVLGLLGVGAYLARPVARGKPPRWLLATGGTCVVIAVGASLWTLTAGSCPPPAALLGIGSNSPPLASTASDSAAGMSGAATDDASAKTKSATPPDWHDILAARGAESRLGQAIFRLVQDQRSAPLAGILVLSDGQQNAGLSCDQAAEAAREAHIQIYPIGLGSKLQKAQVRLADFEAPTRAFPGDYFGVTAFLQANGLAGRSVTVRLRQVPLKEGNGQPAAPNLGLDDQRDVLVGTDQEDLAVKFEVQGIKVPGRYGFELALEGTAASASGSTSSQKFQVEIVDRRTKVLLIAGGPGREYRFLRNFLRRDKRITLDVLLQSAGAEKSQDDYPKMLASFPDSKDKLFDYDCIVALDPDWKRLSASQASLLENWVAEQAGGLIVAPGRVYAGSTVHSWINDTQSAPIQALYPVEFPNMFFRAEDVGRKFPQVQPLELTREGTDAEFLRLDDNTAENQRIWSRQFAGVYGSLPVRGPKPGAVVYARYIDPRAEAGGAEPVYFVGQFYGSGRVFYMGSAEMWRLREVDDARFEQFYTKLVRNVAQGRLLRGSRRGDVLLVEKSRYGLGDTVPIVAHLKNAQRGPLDVEHVTMFLFAPGAERATPLELSRDTTRPGMYRTQFVARREGDYRLELPLADSGEEPLSKGLKVTASALESENPQRNDALLGALAKTTDGRYYVGLDAALGRQSDTPVVNLLKDRTQTTPVLGERDPRWEEFWTRAMMFGICGVLSLEWLLRRLFKLA